jgi:hypothetical protein
MTIASPDDSAIRRSDAINYAPEESTGLEAIYEAVGEVIGELTGKLDKRIKALELALAQANGALDVLRGKGAPGCFRAKGNYDSKIAYSYLDVVVKDSSSFVALRDNPGACPGNDWQMIACGGRRGPAGERGPAGPAGPVPKWFGAGFSHRGMEIHTSNGPVPLFKSVNVDPQSFAIKFVGHDNSTLTINLLPLFEAYHRQTAGT